LQIAVEQENTMKNAIVACVMAALCGAVAAGQGGPKPAPPGPNPFARMIQGMWENAKRNIQESAQQMPAENYGFRPVESVRTFGQILAHVAGTNYVYCASAKGEPSPHGEDDIEKAATTKADIDKALAESLAYCDAAYASLTDATATQMVKSAFSTNQVPRALPLAQNAGHLTEHYGNLVTYFRIKGMVPPSSRRP
jgi:uncharacterized damage-inducible protein DinB